eukprot:1222035-Pleurochrysis_carterae.AAC.2
MGLAYRRGQWRGLAFGERRSKRKQDVQRDTHTPIEPKGRGVSGSSLQPIPNFRAAQISGVQVCRYAAALPVNGKRAGAEALCSAEVGSTQEQQTSKAPERLLLPRQSSYALARTGVRTCLRARPAPASHARVRVLLRVLLRVCACAHHALSASSSSSFEKRSRHSPSESGGAARAAERGTNG